jgi:hypothetical protein
VKTYATCSCCNCCSTTSFSVTSVPSLIYTLTCGTNLQYATISKNLNTPGFNPVVKGALTPPFGCSVPCSYRQAEAPPFPGGGIFCSCAHVPCSGLGNSWAYNAYANISSFRNSSGTYTHVLGLSHRWRTLGTAFPPLADFYVACTWLLTKSDKCPNGTYAALNSTWTDCNGVLKTTGTSYTLSAGGPTVPTCVFGTPSGVPVVA